MFVKAAGHCNEWVGRVGKEVKVVIFMFKDIVVKLRSNDGCTIFF